MDKVEDDLEGLVTTRDPVLLEEMIHRQASSKQRLKYKPHNLLSVDFDQSGIGSTLYFTQTTT